MSNCACDHSTELHNGAKGACRACANDVSRPRCMAFRLPKAKRRKGLRQVSDRRSNVNVERERLQVEAWGPRPWYCVLAGSARAFGHVNGVRIGECRGPVNGHEILSRQRAGRRDDNLLDISGQMPLCDGHNSWCEDWPNEAHELGLTRHSWEARR